MLGLQFDIKRINQLKEILLRLHNEESQELVEVEINRFFMEVGIVEILSMEQELINGDYGITIWDVKRLSSIHPHLYGKTIHNTGISDTIYAAHPVQIFKKENTVFQSILKRINQLLTMFKEGQSNIDEPEVIAQLQQEMFRLGEFHKHYHRKEKLLFPIFERYGYYTPARIMWRADDRVRALYQGTKRQIDQLPAIDLEDVIKTYDTFEKKFKDMIFEEEAIILPILTILFDVADWEAVARESEAFGYALIDVEETWEPSCTEEELPSKAENEKDVSGNVSFGGGFLTTEEANLILNNLPLEITFVDKQSVFKYFNKITAASDMMLVRTPTSIGRNVANCHPPNSLKKVMTLIRDLKTKKRTSESMWFKKRGQYVHLTYKAIFNEQDEYVGILEYVQDIQPFFDLPNEVKTGLSDIEG